ncbi:transcription antitermination factor NusB [Anaerobranca gottschalkii]|uniref:Transcription antitermination protein NusB n=1 Tax=Anaerobranca gottschalkii DSM 13577 TaxID=1120990 RepID=A0A1H9Y3F1_9FIRM|nr:transcription antitermination factor NusB [Anaerobranca gottschalkii]SES62870.1 NusB antitermination factor [Anaerobranca gottschalkii DSM 13577]
MSRKEARELAFQGIYQMDILKEKARTIIDNLLSERPIKDIEYLQDVLLGVEGNLEIIDEKIKKFSKNWKLERLSKVDKAILRLAIYEILFKEDVPDIVAINEGVELAKNYSNEDSPKFINGLLDQIRKEKEMGE